MSDGPLGDLRAFFRESARARISEMRALLERDRLDAEAVRTLARHFHAFAGLGATYGFPRVSDLGDEAEALILPVERGREPLTNELVARWRELVEVIARELDELRSPSK